jgi:hypothetical protein
MQELYEKFLKEPNGQRSHKLLHTHYKDKSHQVLPAYSHHQMEASPVPSNVEAALKAESIIPGPPAPEHQYFGRRRV